MLSQLGIFITSDFDYDDPAPRYLDQFSGRQDCKKFHIELYAHHIKIQMYDLSDLSHVRVQTNIISFQDDPDIKQHLAPAGYILPSAAAEYCRNYQFT